MKDSICALEFYILYFRHSFGMLDNSLFGSNWMEFTDTYSCHTCCRHNSYPCYAWEKLEGERT